MSTGLVYPIAYQQSFLGNISWATDISCALVDSSFAINTADTTWSQVQPDEISGSGYTAGGEALANPLVKLTAANAWPLAWAASSGFAVGSVVIPTTGNGYLYSVIAGSGNSGSTQPTWPTTIGESVVDGSLTWVCAGTSLLAWTADSVTWGNASFTAYGAVFYSTAGGAAAEDYLFGAIQFSAAETTPTAGTFVLNPDPNLGFFSLIVV